MLDSTTLTTEALCRSILERHAGVCRAITSDELSRQTALSTRKVRALIAELIGEGMAIGASVDGTKGGYYLIQTPDELEQTRAILRARAMEIFARDKALCRAWSQQCGQELQPLLPGV